MDKNEFINKIKAKVSKEDENASLILFGSRARGDFREDSDWDFLILTSKDLGFERERKIRDDIYDLELEYTQPVSALIFPGDQWKTMSITPLFQNITTEGKLV